MSEQRDLRESAVLCLARRQGARADSCRYFVHAFKQISPASASACGHLDYARGLCKYAKKSSTDRQQY